MRKGKVRVKMLAGMMLACLWLSAGAHSKGWETVKEEIVASHHVVSDSELEIKTGRGVIYITTSKHLNVKIFTILGSRIADDSLAPGSYQFAVPTHGVYIIKAGELTCKVAV